jgi:hypothetical protein
MALFLSDRSLFYLSLQRNVANMITIVGHTATKELFLERLEQIIPFSLKLLTLPLTATMSNTLAITRTLMTKLDAKSFTFV